MDGWTNHGGTEAADDVGVVEGLDRPHLGLEVSTHPVVIQPDLFDGHRVPEERPCVQRHKGDTKVNAHVQRTMISMSEKWPIQVSFVSACMVLRPDWVRAQRMCAKKLFRPAGQDA